MNKELILHPTIWAILIGVILGFVFSILNFYTVKLSIKSSIDNPKSAFTTSALFMLKPLLLIIPMLAGVLIPKYISLFGVCGGMLLWKAVLFIGAFLKSRR